MSISYDMFTGAFLSKVTEFDFINLDEDDRVATVDGFMKRALSGFRRNCKYDLFTTNDDNDRKFKVDISHEDIDEILDIVSEGMLVQWLKPFVYNQELLENNLNTKDFSTYSPAELLTRIGNAYDRAQKNYTQLIREYSYNHGKLTSLHL